MPKGKCPRLIEITGKNESMSLRYPILSLTQSRRKPPRLWSSPLSSLTVVTPIRPSLCPLRPWRDMGQFSRTSRTATHRYSFSVLVGYATGGVSGLRFAGRR